MTKRRGLFLSLALTALMGLTAREAKAELISMTLIVGTGGGAVTIPVDPFATVTPTSYTVGAAGLTALNLALNAAGSQYNFGTAAGTTTDLGGSSNFPGSSLGQLTVTGEIHSTGTGTTAPLTLIELEGGFTSPTGASGVLMSSSAGNFTNQSSGGGHASHSLFNAITTPTYTVLSTGTSPNPGVNTGPVAVGVAPVSTLYTLTNIMTWGIGPPGLTKSTTSDISDGFSQSAVITAAVPEPASLVTMLMGVPFPLVVLGLLRRRRAAA